MDFQALTNVVGILDACLIFAVIFIWREWRKAEAKLLDLALEQSRDNKAAVARYVSFENVLLKLANLLE